MKKVKSALFTIISIVMIVSFFTGCKQTPTDKSSMETTAVTPGNSPSTTTNYTKSMLELSFGTTWEATASVIQNDVVGPELAKSTGVKWGKFFGLTAPTPKEQINFWSQTNSLPDVSYVYWDQIQTFKDNNLSWSITEDDLKQYAPEIYKRIDPAALINLVQKDGTIPGIPAQMVMSSYDKKLNPNFPPAVGDWMDWRQDYYVTYVRDDILKQVFPSAKTWNELTDVYAQTKKLDFNDYKIAGLETDDDLINLLRKIKALNITENGKKIEPSEFTMREFNTGGDNLSNTAGSFDGYGNWPMWNPNEGTTQLSYLTPSYKAFATKWNKAIREGLVDVNSIVLKDDQRIEKVKRGEYAVVNSQGTAVNTINAALDTYKRPYHFRPVYIKFQPSRDWPGFYPTPAGASAYYFINKKTVKKEDIPKILNFFNYQLTKDGSDLTSYGPESAGLFTVGADGKKKYKDPILEDSMLNLTENTGEKNAMYYGLVNGGGKESQNGRYYSFYNQAGGPYIPRAVAWPLPMKGTTDEMYLSLYRLGGTTVQWPIDPSLGAYTGHDDYVKQSAITVGAENDVATTIMPKVFFAKSNDEFEANFKKAVDKITNEGQWEKTKALSDSIMKEFLAKHPDMAPLPWPVK